MLFSNKLENNTIIMNATIPQSTSLLLTTNIIHVLEKGGEDPINWFNPATFLCLYQTRTWISNVICRGLCYVQWFEVRGYCLFCWYWWNCWPSLVKLSFHNIGRNFSNFFFVAQIHTTVRDGDFEYR